MESNITLNQGSKTERAIKFKWIGLDSCPTFYMKTLSLRKVQADLVM